LENVHRFSHRQFLRPDRIGSPPASDYCLVCMGAVQPGKKVAAVILLIGPRVAGLFGRK
jgi:hypothetical protein